jgi:GNAT superfamily N-acetyltransferase
MKLLRETIQNLMMENASIAGTRVIQLMQQEDLIIVIAMMPPHNGDIYLCNREDFDEDDGSVYSHLGRIKMESIDLEDTMQVSSSRVNPHWRKKGLGKLLYNVALAACTDEGLYLMADREEVSGKAQRIWDTWTDMPQTYDIEQMDEIPRGIPTNGGDEDFLLTQDTEDDVGQGSFRKNDANWASYSDQDPRAKLKDGTIKDWWYFFSEEYKQDFLSSSLTKRFQMKDAYSFTETLEELELLYYM